MADTVSVTQADRIAAIIRDYCKEGVRQEPFGGPLDTADLAARKILASTQPAPAFPREEVDTLLRELAAEPPGGEVWERSARFAAYAKRAAALIQDRQPIRRVKDITDDVIFAFGAELTAIKGQDKLVSGFRMSDGVEIRITAELVEGQHADR